MLSRKNIDETLLIQILTKLVDSNSGTSSSVKARAFSLLSFYHRRIHDYLLAPDPVSTRRANAYLFIAVKYANDAANLNFDCYASMYTAYVVDARCHEDIVRDDVRKSFRNDFGTFWTASSNFHNFLYKDENAVLTDACAARCGVEATKSSQFRACKGNCMPKPLYCDRECQRAVSIHIDLAHVHVVIWRLSVV